MEVKDLLTNERFLDACKRNSKDWQMLRDEVIMKLLERDCSDVNDLLKYACRCAYTISINNYRYNLITEDLTGFEIPNDTNPYNDVLSSLEEKIQSDLQSKKRFYQATLFLGVLRLGSLRKYQKHSQIPFYEVRQTYIDYREYLKSYFKNKE
jgi:hypothetical protein